jgi:hypothetical protein
MAIVLDTEMLSLVGDVSNPYMKSINEALTAEYPDDANAAYTVMMAFQVCGLLNALDPSVRPQAVGVFNHLLGKSKLAYRLVVVE